MLATNENARHGVLSRLFDESFVQFRTVARHVVEVQEPGSPALHSGLFVHLIQHLLGVLAVFASAFRKHHYVVFCFA